MLAQVLRTSVQPLSVSEIKQSTATLLAELRSQGIFIEELQSPEAEKQFAAASSPAEIFATLAAAKQNIARLAPKDMAATLVTINTQAKTLRAALPLLEEQYGIDRGALNAKLIEIEALSATGDPAHAKKLAAAINVIAAQIKRTHGAAGSQSLTPPPAQIAAESQQLTQSLSRIAQGSPVRVPSTAQPEELRIIVDQIAGLAPASLRGAFENNDIAEQQRVLLVYFATQPDIVRLRSQLAQHGNTELDIREQTLAEAIARVGTDRANPRDPCEQSITAMLQCVQVHVAWMEHAARSGFLRTIGGFMEDSGVIDGYHYFFGSDQ